MNKNFSKFCIEGNLSHSLFYELLNPKLFDSNARMHSGVRDHILRVVNIYCRQLRLPMNTVEAIVVTGSNAGYDYDSSSDIDIEVNIPNNSEYGRKLFRSLAIQTSHLNRLLFPEISSIPVNLYLKTKGQGLTVSHTGRYEVISNAWLQHPEKSPVYDEKIISSKVREWIRQITSACENLHTEDSLKCNLKLLSRIRKWREKSLSVSENAFGSLVYRHLARTPEFKQLKESILNLLSSLSKYSLPEDITETVKVESSKNIYFEDLNEIYSCYTPTSQELWAQCSLLESNDTANTKLSQTINSYTASGGRFARDSVMYSIVLNTEAVRYFEDPTFRTISNISRSILEESKNNRKLTSSVKKSLDSAYKRRTGAIGKIMKTSSFLRPVKDATSTWESLLLLSISDGANVNEIVKMLEVVAEMVNLIFE